jgi:5'-nucleotidase
MKILLTNDDGIEAPGINALEKVLKENGHEIIVVAPIKEQSATSHSLTLHDPLRIVDRGENRYAVTGSPADCVIVASRIILKEAPDLVVSGINAGQNMAEDVLYSGTVAAAMEAMFMGYKSIAISLAAYKDQKFETAAHYLNELLKDGIHELIDDYEVFNVNIPNVEIGEVKGIKIVPTGNRRYQDFVKEQTDPRGRKIYWIGGGNPIWCREGESDYKAVEENYISITPIAPRFTKEESFGKLKKWVKES